MTSVATLVAARAEEDNPGLVSTMSSVTGASPLSPVSGVQAFRLAG